MCKRAPPSSWALVTGPHTMGEVHGSQLKFLVHHSRTRCYISMVAFVAGKSLRLASNSADRRSLKRGREMWSVSYDVTAVGIFPLHSYLYMTERSYLFLWVGGFSPLCYFCIMHPHRGMASLLNVWNKLTGVHETFVGENSCDLVGAFSGWLGIS